MSSSSGATVNNECHQAFDELKLGKKLKWVIYKLNDKNSEIVIDRKDDGEDNSGGQEQYESFIEKLPESEPRYAVYDFDFQIGEGGQRNKIVFINWNPDSAKIKPKMVYSSSKDALKRGLNGVALEVQITDQDEADYKTVLEKVSKGVR